MSDVINRIFKIMVVSGFLLLVAGNQPEVRAGTIEAINLTHWAINHFSVNGQPGIDIIGPYRGGGGGCCFGVPAKWKPGMTVRIDWKSGKMLKNMATTSARLGLCGSHNRYEEFTRQLRALNPLLKPALAQPESGKPKLLDIKLYVYGFSREAATTARTFVRWLSELLPENAKPEPCLAVDDVQIPVSVEFLWLFNAVASVGIAHIAPFADGHMAWADSTMELQDDAIYGGLIKGCVNLVSSHEQRLCFPLDAILRGDGHYPANSTEAIYPGIHSDVGGRYPPGDRGKATGTDDGRLLSQIVLNDLYAQAFKVGKPIKFPRNHCQRYSYLIATGKWLLQSLRVLMLTAHLLSASTAGEN